MRVLVTGATGFVGSHAAVALGRARRPVRYLVRSRKKLERVLGSRNVDCSDVVEGDVTD